MNRITSTTYRPPCSRLADTDEARNACGCCQCVEDLVKKEYPPRRWRHEPGEARCACEFPNIWTAYPDECNRCMRLLPDVPRGHIHIKQLPNDLEPCES